VSSIPTRAVSPPGWSWPVFLRWARAAWLTGNADWHPITMRGAPPPCRSPRGSDVIVGALLCEPADPANAAGVIFFNNAGYLGM
jgi:proline racemase